MKAKREKNIYIYYRCRWDWFCLCWWLLRALHVRCQQIALWCVCAWVCLNVHMQPYMCVDVCPVTIVTSTVQSITLSPNPWLYPPPLSSPSQQEVMSLRADGAQIKLTPRLLLLSIGELKLVYFYDLFISLLPPPACMQGRQGDCQWPGAWSTGPRPGPGLCGQIFPQPIKIKPIVMFIK